MNLEYRQLLKSDFQPNSKVWVYQSNRLLSLNEALEAEEMINEFISVWLSHGDAVKAAGHLFFGQFVVLIADESQTHVGGCSTDSSTRFIKSLEERFKISLFDRNQLAFVVKEKIELVPLSQVPYAFENGFITPETLYFNNLVNTKIQLEENWIIPLKDSWVYSRVGVSA